MSDSIIKIPLDPNQTYDKTLDITQSPVSNAGVGALILLEEPNQSIPDAIESSVLRADHTHIFSTEAIQTLYRDFHTDTLIVSKPHTSSYVISADRKYDVTLDKIIFSTQSTGEGMLVITPENSPVVLIQFVVSEIGNRIIVDIDPANQLLIASSSIIELDQTSLVGFTTPFNITLKYK